MATSGNEVVTAMRSVAIAEIATTATNILGNDLSRSYLTIDTSFLSSTKEMWHCWFDPGMRSLLQRANEIALDTKPHRFARLFVVPRPTGDSNRWTRDEYCAAVKETLHLHLLHGVVCFVLFTSRRKRAHAKLGRSIDFGAIGKGLTFDTSTFYEEDFSAYVRLNGTSADDHVKRVFSEVATQDNRLLKLYYDDGTFEQGRKLTHVRWQAFRQLLIELYGSVCQGSTYCKRRGEKLEPRNIEIDHIIPTSRGGNNILLNLRPLCQDCNRTKGNMFTDDPFAIAFGNIPLDKRSDEVRRWMSTQAPDWIGGRMGSPRDIRHYHPVL